MSPRYLLASLVVSFLDDGIFRIHATTETFKNAYVITKFSELSDFYEKLRPQNSQNESRLSDYNKDSLCEQIFGFNVAVNPDEDGYETLLKSSNYALFEELFKAVEIPKNVLSRMMFKNKRVKYNYVYDNSTKSRTFLVGGSKREENTFVCAVRKFDLGNDQIDMYFVSDYGYNVNDSKDGEEIFGRFVFFDNEIYGLAEEHPRTRPIVERDVQSTDYTTIWNRYKVAEKWENDPVCKLDSGRKLRLCTYVCAYSGKECADRVTVQEPCQRREFTWRNESYDGWMLECIVSRRKLLFDVKIPTYEKRRYVAHTYSNNEAFVFRKGLQGELQFRFKLTKVPVVVQEQIAD